MNPEINRIVKEVGIYTLLYIEHGSIQEERTYDNFHGLTIYSVRYAKKS